MLKTAKKNFYRLALWGNFIISHISKEQVFRKAYAQFHMSTTKASENLKAIFKNLRNKSQGTLENKFNFLQASSTLRERHSNKRNKSKDLKQK